MDEWLAALALRPGLFVTGTDTGVGKTWVGQRLIRALRANGREVAPRKPAESGWPDDVAQTDAWLLATAAGASLDAVCPNRLAAALSPPRAAQLEGKTLRIAELAAQCRAGLQAGQFLYVEGAGGFYSPLAADGLNADLAQALELPVLVVAEDRVGCINHLLLTCEALERRGLELAGVVLNPRQPAPLGMDNLSDLQPLLRCPILRFGLA